ncbi:helix-turn-helix transcriptional regulator [Neobacillus cucumis]|uniref:helix-turn-helix domain-containing protein n=1 Tax=Neobacillus cucumis TaxID=1740721 RepID=UPI00203DE73F|nr:helix-turn-helix transcriptional regulator [Neobacillus cucumis]MCM3728713.1 helix-turn-helix transcriptional regulator [Neobacillus cucumis]
MIKFKLNEVLERKGKTMYWLSKTTGIRPNTISQWANNETLKMEDQVKSITIDNLDKICTALECEIEDLFQHIKNK